MNKASRILISTSLLFVGLFGMGSPASEADSSSKLRRYYFYAQSESWPPLQKLKNCLHYEVCGTHSVSHAGGEGNARLHIRFNLSPSELNSVLNACPFSEWRDVNIQIFDESQSPSRPIEIPDWIPPANEEEFEWKREILHLSGELGIRIRTQLRQIQNYADADDSELLLDLLREIFRGHLRGYSLGTREMGETVGAVIEHQKKEIWINPPVLQEGACNIVRVVRHELEHAFQVERAAQCSRQMRSLDLQNHRDRELSAYLNDAFAISNYCEDERTVARQTQEAVWQFLSYLSPVSEEATGERLN